MQAILIEKDPGVLEQMEFDEEGDTFLARTENEETVTRFMKFI
ncbi:hypothetical protein [Hymenobacter lapidarius]